jgi:hypothetical protein
MDEHRDGKKGNVSESDRLLPSDAEAMRIAAAVILEDAELLRRLA